MVTFKSSDEIYQIVRMATKHHHVGWCQNLCVVTGSGRDKMIRSHCLPVVGLAQHILEYKFKYKDVELGGWVVRVPQHVCDEWKTVNLYTSCWKWLAFPLRDSDQMARILFEK